MVREARGTDIGQSELGARRPGARADRRILIVSDSLGAPSIAAAVRAYLKTPEAFCERIAAADVDARMRFALSAHERAVEARFGRAAAATQ